jgi:hypothetical protein
MVRIFIVICFGASYAMAQQPDSKTAAYMWNPEMQKRLYALALYMDKNVLGKTNACTGSVRLDPISIGLLTPLSFSDGNAHPNKGAWTIRYRFDRCGEAITYNAFFRANEQGPATIFHLPPGTTKASPTLMQDLNPALFMAAAKNTNDKDCKLVVVTNTIVTAEPAPVKVEDEILQGVWEELWTVRTCSGSLELDFCFIPAKSGGTTWIQSKCDPARIATARAVNRK